MERRGEKKKNIEIADEDLENALEHMLYIHIYNTHCHDKV